MKVSIITVCYNAQDTIEATVKSVLEQTYSDIEYIVIDGGSTDTTVQILNKYKNSISKLVSERDKGLYDAMNKGLVISTGDVIGFLHADDLFANHHIVSDYVNCFKENNCDAVYADLHYVSRDDSNKIVRTWKSGVYKDGAFKQGWMPPHPTFYVKSEIYKKLGGYTLALKTAADYELMLRFIHLNKIKLAYLQRFVVKMRVGGKSNISFRSRINANLEDRKAWAMNGLKPAFYTLFIKPLRKILQFL